MRVEKREKNYKRPKLREKAWHARVFVQRVRVLALLQP